MVSAALRAGRLGIVELTRAHLARVARRDPKLRHVTLLREDHALAEARRAEDELRAGVDRGPLHGIAYGVKDVIDVAGLATTCNSRLRLDHRASEDSAVVSRLRAAGAVLIGKLATSEFACGGASDDQPFPAARNPWDTSRYTGGSSAGSAGAIAAGMLRIAIGSDTGGSIRVPASHCGVVGFKPSRGLVPTRGLFPLAASLDHVGPLGAGVHDTALALNAIADAPIDLAVLGLGAARMRVAYARELMGEAGATGDLIARLDGVAETLRALGASVAEIALPGFANIRETYRTITAIESFALHAHDLRERPDGYGRHTYRRLIAGEGLGPEDLARASAAREDIRARLDAALTDHDAILLSTGLDEAPILTTALDAPAQTRPGSPTILASLTGHPALSLPIALSRNGLPLGAQIIGRLGEDATVLRLARALESTIDFRRRFAPSSFSP